MSSGFSTTMRRTWCLSRRLAAESLGPSVRVRFLTSSTSSSRNRCRRIGWPWESMCWKVGNAMAREIKIKFVLRLEGFLEHHWYQNTTHRWETHDRGDLTGNQVPQIAPSLLQVNIGFEQRIVDVKTRTERISDAVRSKLSSLM